MNTSIATNITTSNAASLLPEVQSLILSYLSTEKLGCEVSLVCEMWSKFVKEELEERESKRLDLRRKAHLCRGPSGEFIFPKVFPNDHLLAGKEIDWKKIEYLDISRNEIRSIVLSSKALPNLTHFNCSGNQLTSLVLPEALPNLKIFNCFNNQLRTSGLVLPEALPNLKEFRCFYNRLTSLVLPEEGLPNLKWFDCSYNRLTSLVLPEEGLPNLKEFNCSHNKLGTPGLILPEGSEALPNLVYFNCSNNQLGASGLVLPKGGLPKNCIVYM
jgi:Leucine-rich repeat (LRR) protein